MKHPRLLLLPLLLLVPLVALKWRADHPPLSEMDKKFQAAIDQASWVQIDIRGPVIKGDGEIAFDIRDKALMQELPSALRCQEGEASELTGQRKSGIAIYVVKSERPEDCARFFYSGTEQGSVLKSDSESATVRSNFAPRFEALISQLAERAKTPGSGPGVVRIGTT